MVASRHCDSKMQDGYTVKSRITQKVEVSHCNEPLHPIAGRHFIDC